MWHSRGGSLPALDPGGAEIVANHGRTNAVHQRFNGIDDVVQGGRAWARRYRSPRAMSANSQLRLTRKLSPALLLRDASRPPTVRPCCGRAGAGGEGGRADGVHDQDPAGRWHCWRVDACAGQQGVGKLAEPHGVPAVGALPRKQLPGRDSTAPWSSPARCPDLRVGEVTASMPCGARPGAPVVVAWQLMDPPAYRGGVRRGAAVVRAVYCSSVR